ncbi:type 1 fimbrial protein [Vibrio parahaemolyticus]|uniref:fimbrial protein n=1 Tax=Vibrio parahaemolyticus TaxID=670 RepID=UPI0005F0ECE4|nr:fimbrial protein [Vibrio parahaemolyticus]EGQ9864753.1 type 1 fimbrial protein [Vibrio parahaemolyticus]EGR2010875.1 type 1 fimbrial protein [Vibrio parahaemolyticus]EGR2037009.1 type 1 fimbrial protein [Vibrio parahaemolyticus]EGR2060828.1 type 1 fimbrial protein [Vibrio parahaemolyticus]EGR2132513.1 type 1 fimbrial protein [Vibrio parahaemolyticus]
MKKVSLATIILASLASSSVFANTGTVNFIGSITDTTCDFTAEQDGAQTNNVDLGTWAVSKVMDGSTEVKSFSLVGKKEDGSVCEVGGGKSVDVSWIPVTGSWDAYGLQNTGTAKGAAVKLMDKDDNAFSTVKTSVTYSDTEATDGRLPFKAQIVKTGANVEAGTVLAAASFSVAYK